MKAILISDKSKWCALMMKKIKKIEVRKNTALYKAIQKLIDEYGCALIYVSCTKDKPNLWLPYEYDCFESDEASQPYLSDEPIFDIDTKMNGKVIFKFRCYKVDKWDIWQDDLEEKLKLSCLSVKEFDDYSKGQVAYAIHISDLEIFDKPKEFSEFYKYTDKKIEWYTGLSKVKVTSSLTKAPQNFCYVEVDE